MYSYFCCCFDTCLFGSLCVCWDCMSDYVCMPAFVCVSVCLYVCRLFMEGDGVPRLMHVARCPSVFSPHAVRLATKVRCHTRALHLTTLQCHVYINFMQGLNS